MTPPVLDTDRLRLRGHRIEDLEFCLSLWTDPCVIRYTTGFPLSREECWARLLRYSGHWTMMGFGYWVIEEKVTSSFVGEVGFGNNKRELEPSAPPAPEAGWALISSAHGKGFATEALRTILRWGKGNLGSQQTICLIHPENYRSMRVAEKCGYRRYNVAMYNEKTMIVFMHQWHYSCA